MKYKPGDKVQLVNEAMKATVSKLFSDKEVYVLDENGFEYRVKMKDIVPLAEEESYMEDGNFSEQGAEGSSAESIIKYFSGKRSCFFCIVPDDFSNLLNSGYSVILVNTTDESLLYSLHFPDDTGNYSTYGIVEPDMEVAEKISGSGVPFRGFRFLLHFIIHGQEDRTGERRFSFTADDFLSPMHFLSYELFDNHILAFDINAVPEMEIPEGEIKKLVDYFSPEKNISAKPSPSGKKKNEETALLTNEKTVDLHIEELAEDYAGMSSGEMLNLQLAHFRKELDTAMLNHFYRIIFIHGKGNGVLKNRIRTELEAMNLKFKDADTARFGFGATEVML